MQCAAYILLLTIATGTRVESQKVMLIANSWPSYVADVNPLWPSIISLQVHITWSLHLVNVIWSCSWQWSTIRERPNSCGGITTAVWCWATTLHTVGWWCSNVFQNHNSVSNQNALEEQPITCIEEQSITHYIHLCMHLEITLQHLQDSWFHDMGCSFHQTIRLGSHTAQWALICVTNICVCNPDNFWHSRSCVKVLNQNLPNSLEWCSCWITLQLNNP